MNRRIRFTALSALCVFILGGCGPMAVTSDLVKMYPMTSMINDVKVYEGEKSPANYDHLGTVAVYDKGMTRVTSYETTLDMAKRAVCEAGGNAIYISRHEWPNSLVSANHQIVGQILYDTGSKAGTNDGPAKALPVKKEIADYTTDIYTIRNRAEIINGNNIYASVGYGRLLSGIDLGDDIEVTNGSLLNGLSYNFGFEHIFPDGRWGIGIFNSNYTSAVSADMSVKTSIIDSVKTTNTTFKYDGKYRINLHAAGPSVSYSHSAGRVFTSLRLGLGLAWQTETFAFSDLIYGPSIDAESGVMQGTTYFGGAVNLSGEIVYRVSSVVSIGATLGFSEYMMVYSDDTTYNLGTAPTLSICPTIRISL